jgi:hypothetical protein
LKAFEKWGVGDKQVRESNGRGGMDHGEHTLRSPFEHQLKY